MRRQFQMPEGDIALLRGLNLEWETVKVEQATWLILPRFAVPAGYNHALVSGAFRIPASYPDDQIDMAYFYPALALNNGRTIGGLSMTALDGKEYQQWSRHRTSANPWRPEIDSIATHLILVQDWLKKELG